ncbi:MAG: ABC transporter six-transmembrane domain-containing protein [Pseudomonadota bacterium]
MTSMATPNTPVIAPDERLSLRVLLRAFRWKVCVTWGLMLLETALFALMPLLISWSIDELLTDDWLPFWQLVFALGALLVVATGRRIYDTRAYGTMRVALSQAQVERSEHDTVSVQNARVMMGRELVDFLETTAPEAVAALVQVIVAIIVLLSFHGTLALTSSGAILAMLLIYAVFSKRFFRLNAALNARSEGQVSAIETRNMKRVAGHFMGLRREEIRLSDTESLVYGLIFLVLLSMLAFNLWFGATQMQATPGQTFAIVSYSLEYLQSAVQLPLALQALTRLSAITERINQTPAQMTADA